MKLFKVKHNDKVYLIRATDSVSAAKKFKDSVIKDVNQVLLSNLKQVAQKGDAWWNKWQNVLGMTDKWNFHQWEELRNNDPKKYELIIRNKQYAKKEAEALNREWDRAIDALSRDRSFGKPGDYRMDLHGYKSSNNDYPVGNIDKYNHILYGYEQAEKSAKAKKGLDSSIKTLNSKLRDFDDTKKNINVVREFITNNGGKFSKSKDADAILDFIYKKTGVKNADYGDVLYIVRNYTNVKIDDTNKDGNNQLSAPKKFTRWK